MSGRSLATSSRRQTQEKAATGFTELEARVPYMCALYIAHSTASLSHFTDLAETPLNCPRRNGQGVRDKLRGPER